MTEKPITRSASRARSAKIVEFPRRRFPAPGASYSQPLAAGTVNQRELISIKALIAYVAHIKGVGEDIVRACLHTEFDIADSAALRHDDFDRAIRFLVD